jgi:hypothetical protein
MERIVKKLLGYQSTMLNRHSRDQQATLSHTPSTQYLSQFMNSVFVLYSSNETTWIPECGAKELYFD